MSRRCEMTVAQLTEQLSIVSQQTYDIDEGLTAIIRWTGAAEAFQVGGDEQRANLCWSIADIIEERRV